MPATLSTKVLSGPYAGFTRAEMLIEWARYKTALQASGSGLVGSSVNGQSFQFGPRRDWSLVTWGRTVRVALAQVDPEWLAESSSIAVQFSGY